MRAFKSSSERGREAFGIVGEGQKVHPESYLDRHPFLLEEKEERFVSLLFLPFQTDQDSDGPR